MADSTLWWLRPRIVFSALAIMVVLAVLLTPAQQPGEDEPYLTSYSFAPNGARGLHDVASRLGWRAERRLEPFRGVLDTAATYLVLLPPIDLTSGEVGVLLSAVRRGAGLIVIPPPGSPIAESLGLRQSPKAPVPLTTAPDDSILAGIDSTAPDGPQHQSDDDRGLFSHGVTYEEELYHLLETTRPVPPGSVNFLVGRRFNDSTVRPVVLGRTLGRGRVVAVADHRIVLNDMVRDTGFALLPVRMIEYASTGRGTPVVFAEYHQGFGRHASLTRAMTRGLLHTPVGRALGALCVAALLLLFSLAMRPMPPRPRARIERRSPLEHVSALARAYEQVGATRTAVRHLVRGLRRRRVVGRRTVSDTDMLRALAERHPLLAPEVERIVTGTSHPVAPAELLAIGRDIATIERTIYQ